MAAENKNAHEIALAKQLKHIPWCEEYEKMISGMLYDSFQLSLSAARFKARTFAHRYNQYFPEPSTNPTFETLQADRFTMLEGILGRVGPGCLIEPPFYVVSKSKGLLVEQRIV
ncbi:unnamed protein product [Periconia digitata]|uniref:Maltose/galactoside acetyltransferase domain-containing protein n=1 Tax=Periconia digitata TaxID=1303443 RepID=A0A9W4UHB6_9PLEO|nr:unnamed protein product [Periconia digitata]